jgi:aryl-phospho-beta-D-glucosidase BglC (GH1 family)
MLAVDFESFEEERPTMLRVQGDAVVDAEGARVLLRGAGLGGWMNMENFVTGYPANEAAMRAAVAALIGGERADRFFDRLLDRFFGGEDARLLASLGVNCLRLPINSRAFERDDEPFALREEGFERLARAVDTCAAHGIYTVIDMHAVPGAQNQHWHSDNATHEAAFWQHPHFQDRIVNLWVALAGRFRGHPWVAGYNLLNEPGDPSGAVVGPFHDRLVAAIREVDPDHIVFVDGNTYSTDFSIFGEPYENAVYALHDYARAGMSFGGPYPGETRGVWVDRDALEETFLARTRFQRETGTPIWVGEFGPVYTGDPERDEQRYQVLSDQLDIYDRYAAGWSIWTYKDVGLHGLVSPGPDTAYMERFGDLIAKKRRLGVDAWGSTGAELSDVLEPVHDLIAREFPSWAPYPWGVREATDLLLKHILLAQAMLPEYAERFRGLSDGELDELADSFALGHCRRRARLCDLIAARVGAEELRERA